VHFFLELMLCMPIYAYNGSSKKRGVVTLDGPVGNTLLPIRVPKYKRGNKNSSYLSNQA
jgi:hypothetical protein